MPLRYMNRDQGMLMPPDLDEWVAQDHPVRFVAAFVDELDRADWEALEIDPDGAAIGPPAYAPRVLLAAWLYGFMSGGALVPQTGGSVP
jgi:transposase